MIEEKQYTQEDLNKAITSAIIEMTQVLIKNNCSMERYREALEIGCERLSDNSLYSKEEWYLRLCKAADESLQEKPKQQFISRESELAEQILNFAKNWNKKSGKKVPYIFIKELLEEIKGEEQ